MIDNNKAKWKRTCVKLTIIAVLTIVALAGLVHFVDDPAIDGLKHNFSVWTIIALIAIINLVSFTCFIVFSIAYRWVRSDFPPNPVDDLDSE